MKKALSKDIKGIEFFNTLKRFKWILIISLLILIYLLIPINTLFAKNFKTNEYLSEWKVKDGKTFTIEYIHSVEKSPVTEKYRVKKDKIILLETTFKSFGAGLPATTIYKFELIEDGFRIYDINKEHETVIYRTGDVIADHELQINGKVYKFLDFSKGRTGVEFSIKKTNYLNYLIRKILK